jgi:predicted O-methyltransferase YrrM
LIPILHHPRLWLALPSRIHELREHGRVQDWVDFAFSSPFAPIQKRDEITRFIESVAKLRPRTVLEIGTAAGGTLLLLTLAAARDATIISVDLPGGPFGGGYPRWKAPYFERFAVASQQLRLLAANSRALATRRHVQTILAGRSLDVLLIDGDHTYGGVRSDWEMYRPLLTSDGLAAFHDIVPHPPETGCEVNDYWQELKETFAHQEIVADRAEAWGGIGVIWPGRPRGQLVA